MNDGHEKYHITCSYVQNSSRVRVLLYSASTGWQWLTTLPACSAKCHAAGGSWTASSALQQWLLHTMASKHLFVSEHKALVRFRKVWHQQCKALSRLPRPGPAPCRAHTHMNGSQMQQVLWQATCLHGMHFSPPSAVQGSLPPPRRSCVATEHGPSQPVPQRPCTGPHSGGSGRPVAPPCRGPASGRRLWQTLKTGRREG